jgi:hypothetical protein
MKFLTYYSGLILSNLVFQFSFSQTTIEGKVTDQNNQPLLEQILLFRILILEQLLMKRVILPFRPVPPYL